MLTPWPGRPAAAEPLIITGEARWTGKVDLHDDVLVNETGRLIIEDGTEIVLHASDGTRTDPQFFAAETEIMVRGRLETAPAGEKALGVRLTSQGAGIIADGPTAVVIMRRITISGGAAGVTAVDAYVELDDATIADCRHGILLLGKAKATLRHSRLTNNDIAVADLSGGLKLEDVDITGSRDKDLLDRAAAANYAPPQWYRLPYRRQPSPLETEYLGDQAINADTTWEGRIIIRGQVAVQAGATLTIGSGTEVAFRRHDTNGDGLGESQLLVLGRLKVLGTPENWVLFTSAEKEKRAGDWDKVSIISSEASDNIVRYARFEYGYQAFHNHFSQAYLEAVIFSDNYRGVQFQESPQTTVNGAWFIRNKSAMRFRDSRVDLSGCLVEGNVTGINYLRCRTAIRDSAVSGNLMDPLLGRESTTILDRVLVTGNGWGPRFKGDGSRLEMDLSAVHHNFEDGLSLSGADAAIMRAVISGNGLDGLSVTGGKVAITESSLAGNGRWALDNNGAAPVATSHVWWGTPDAAAARGLIYDGARDPNIGRVLLDAPRSSPPGLFFIGLDPGAGPWGGWIHLLGDFTWPPNRDLAFLPGSRVVFQPAAALSPLDPLRDHPNFQGPELIVSGGSLRVIGEKGKAAAFIGLDDAEGRPCGAVNLDLLSGFSIKRAKFRGLATAIHIRESSGSVEECLFADNGVGLRFNTSAITVRGNLFENNRQAIRFHYGDPRIIGNVFRGNFISIFVSDEPRGHFISGNSFFDADEYHISLGESAADNLSATGNWWGAAAEAEIEAKLFDRNDSSHLGRVLWQPSSDKPPSIDVDQ